MSGHAAQCERFFREADTDHAGYLTLQELTNMLRSHGYKMSDEQIRGMFNSLDAQGDNKVTLEEFMDAMGERPPHEHKSARMRQVFRSFDRNGDGKIDASELKAAFEQMRQHLSDDEVQRMMSMIDTQHKGYIDYEEFIAKMFGNQQANKQ